MLTIFSIPKPFAGHIGLIQRNALASWRRLAPAAEIILFGADAGVAEAAREFGARHVPDLATNAYGTPLISAAFARVGALSERPHLLYSNADMLYDRSLFTALDQLRPLPVFLCSGRRWDMDIRCDLTRADESTWARLFATATTQGRLHGPAGMDYFLFPRSLQVPLPEFAVGRPGWDSWMVWWCRTTDRPVVDATQSVTAVHQNHDYSSLPLGYQHWRGPERELNVRAAGGLTHMLTLREASHELVPGGLRRPTGWGALPARLATFRPYQWSLAGKRWLLEKLG